MSLKPLLLPKASILVLEDDPHLRAGLCHLLADEGYRAVDRADDGIAVDLALVSAGPGRAPGSALAALPPLACAVPVIALVNRAAWVEFGFLDAANEVGAVAVLQRPFSRPALLRLIAAVLSSGAAAETEGRDEASADLSELIRRLESPRLS